MSTRPETQVFREARRKYQERFGVLAIANSIDGRTFTFRAPLSLQLNPGDYARIVTDSGVVLIGQIHERAIFDVQGPQVSIADTGVDLEASGLSVNEASIHLQASIIRGSGVIVGQIAPTIVKPIVDASSNAGFVDAEIAVATADDLRLSYEKWANARPTLEVGHVRSANDSLAAVFDARGFNRHTFLCGQSGSGKTYSLGVVLEQLLVHTDLRVAVLDPNADYVKLKTLHPGRNAGVDGTEGAEIDRYQRRLSTLKIMRPLPEAGDGSEPLRIRFSDLSRDDQARVLALDPLADREEYDAFRGLARGLGRSHYQLRDVEDAGRQDLSASARQVLLRISNLGITDWAVWANERESSLADTLEGDWRSVVLDVSRFEHPIERSVIALALLRHFWNEREQRKPVLLVIDEAHNVCPRDPVDPVQAAATELAIAIAGEGRKYGIYLFLSTQRPDKLHPNVVSQCDNLMLMRMNSAIDLADLQRIFSFVPPAIIEESLNFRQGEALIAGKLVDAPILIKMGKRFSAEGGADVPTDWVHGAE